MSAFPRCEQFGQPATFGLYRSGLRKEALRSPYRDVALGPWPYYSLQHPSGAIGSASSRNIQRFARPRSTSPPTSPPPPPPLDPTTASCAAHTPPPPPVRASARPQPPRWGGQNSGAAPLSYTRHVGWVACSERACNANRPVPASRCT